MGIRLVGKEDYEQVFYLDAYCFPWLNDVRDRAKDFVLKHIPEDAILGYYDDSGMLNAMLFILPFSIYIYGSPVGMGGIASVSSMPEGRHGGKVTQLLRRSIEIMRERKEFVSMLGPFSYEFYRRYGWELGFERLNYTIPVEHFSNFTRKTGYVKPYREGDVEILDKIYSEYARKHNGCTVRDKTLWTDFVLEDPYGRDYPKYTYIWLDDGNNARGYIIYSIKNNRMTIQEMIYLDQAAKEGLFWFIFVHQSQIKEVYWSTAPDERLYLDIPNPRVKMEISPSMMFRVIDVKHALLSRGYDGDVNARFSISISDPNAEWNNKGFLIEIEDGHIDIGETESPESSCSIQTFSQIFTGYITPEEACMHRKLTGDSKTIREMGMVFKKSSTFNNNPF